MVYFEYICLDEWRKSKRIELFCNADKELNFVYTFWLFTLCIKYFLCIYILGIYSF